MPRAIIDSGMLVKNNSPHFFYHHSSKQTDEVSIFQGPPPLSSLEHPERPTWPERCARPRETYPTQRYVPDPERCTWLKAHSNQTPKYTSLHSPERITSLRTCFNSKIGIFLSRVFRGLQPSERWAEHGSAISGSRHPESCPPPSLGPHLYSLIFRWGNDGIHGSPKKYTHGRLSGIWDQAGTGPETSLEDQWERVRAKRTGPQREKSETPPQALWGTDTITND